jgi:hypothetical protein
MYGYLLIQHTDVCITMVNLKANCSGFTMLMPNIKYYAYRSPQL